MQVGDLVKCVWQPRSAYDSEKQCLLPMEYQIDNKMGIVIDIRNGRCQVLFPQFGYSHPLAFSALELISEKR